MIKWPPIIAAVCIGVPLSLIVNANYWQCGLICAGVKGCLDGLCFVLNARNK